MREFALLKHVYAANSALGNGVLIGPGDDMAMVELGGRRLLAAVDQVIDGRHFRLETTPLELIGRKAVTRSLSDIAAMAGVPVATLVSVALPPGFGEDRAAKLFDVMRYTAAEFNCPLIGGDIGLHREKTHPLTCSVTVLAEPLPELNGRAITRSGAQPGDAVFVTGSLGGSLNADGLGRHLTFEPRISIAQQLARALGDRLHAMIDISDGLGRDASHIAEMSGVRIELNAADIPCQQNCDWKKALSDGEDYELLFAAKSPMPKEIDGVRITQVGEVKAKMNDAPEELVVVRERGNIIAASELGWDHRD
jgi:thiamine-monophosphate kinase